MHRLLWAVAIISVVGCSSSDRNFEMVQGEEGLLYRLDVKSGELSLVDGTEIIDLPIVGDDSLARIRVWPDVTLPNGITAGLRTKWRDGHLYYQFEATPYEGAIARAQQGYSLTRSFGPALLDSDGFEVVEFAIPISTVTRLVGDDGEPAAIRANGVVSLGADAYRSAQSWTTTWNLE